LNEMQGKTVVIVGGGDAALENTIILSETADKIFVIHRRSKFTARNEFLRMAEGSEKVEFLLNAQITRIFGTDMVEGVELTHLSSGDLSRIEANAVLIRVGVEPNTDIFRGQIELDEAGYININATCATNMRGIFAVGDVADRIAPTIAAAVGHGAIAAKAIVKELSS